MGRDRIFKLEKKVQILLQLQLRKKGRLPLTADNNFLLEKCREMMPCQKFPTQWGFLLRVKNFLGTHSTKSSACEGNIFLLKPIKIIIWRNVRFKTSQMKKIGLKNKNVQKSFFSKQISCLVFQFRITKKKFYL